MVIIMDATTAARRPLLTRDKSFYKTVVRLMTAIIFQNLISYSVNMADNIMLGMYSQNALSGAATVNQIQFMVQQLTLAVGDSIVVIGGQYWGKKKSAEIRLLTFYALAIGIIFAAGVFIWTCFFPAGGAVDFHRERRLHRRGSEVFKADLLHLSALHNQHDSLVVASLGRDGTSCA